MGSSKVPKVVISFDSDGAGKDNMLFDGVSITKSGPSASGGSTRSSSAPSSNSSISSTSSGSTSGSEPSSNDSNSSSSSTPSSTAATMKTNTSLDDKSWNQVASTSTGS